MIANPTRLTQGAVGEGQAIKLVAAEAITVGMAIRIDGTGRAALASAATAAAAQAVGIALQTVAVGGTVAVQVLGKVIGYTGLTPGGTVWVHPTAGRVTQTRADVGAQSLTRVGTALTADTILVQLVAAAQ